MHFAAKPFRVGSKVRSIDDINVHLTSPMMAASSDATDAGLNRVTPASRTAARTRSSEGLTETDIKVPDLILQFTKMNVAPSTSGVMLPRRNNTAISATKPHTSSPAISSVKKRRLKAKPASQAAKVILRPSKLSLTLASAAVASHKLDKQFYQRRDCESLFREFSTACSKELESIVRVTPSSDLLARPSSSSKLRLKKKKTKSESCVDLTSVGVEQQRRRRAARRKTSSCAEQARQSNDEMSEAIDILADYLEESIVFPKKMSYMAELMYT